MLKTTIPYVDLRDRTPVDLLRAYPDKAREVIKNAKRTLGVVSQAAQLVAMPYLDRRSKTWLLRTKNPYFSEIESIADILGVSGVYTLNLAYEWGCTGGVYRTDDSVSLLRVLDWPFPQLGKHVMVVLQQGKAGEYYNITWPGLTGVVNAMAPSRFSVTLNLAPMRRHHLTYPGDWLKNRLITGQEDGLPAPHLLRRVCDEAKSYGEAKEWLVKTPLAVPAIFLLAGTQPGEGCVIERLENAAEVMELSAHQRVTAANHFTSDFSKFGKGWRPRLADSVGRQRQGENIAGHDLLKAENFHGLQAPIINRFTRLCLMADAATRRLVVQGFEGAVPVTEIFSLPAQPRDQWQVQGTAWN